MLFSQTLMGLVGALMGDLHHLLGMHKQGTSHCHFEPVKWGKVVMQNGSLDMPSDQGHDHCSFHAPGHAQSFGPYVNDEVERVQPQEICHSIYSIKTHFFDFFHF